MIGPRGARLVGVVLMVGGKALDTAATVYALSVAPHVFEEQNSLAGSLYSDYGFMGMVALTVVAVGMLYGVTEYGADVTRRQSEGDTLRKNLTAVYGLGYWVPGVWWLWIGLYNINLVYTVLHGGVPVA